MCPNDLAPVWKACIIGLRLPLGGRRSRVANGASGMFCCHSNEWAKTSQATWKPIPFDPTKILKSGPATMEASSSTFSISRTKFQLVFLSGCLLCKTAGVLSTSFSDTHSLQSAYGGSPYQRFCRITEIRPSALLLRDMASLAP